MLKRTTQTGRWFTTGLMVLPLVVGVFGGKVPAAPVPLQTCATVPDLGSLIQEVGGDLVTVTVFAKGTEDSHFVEPKPTFIKALSGCDLYVQVGLNSEIGWAPVLLQNARNGAVLPGGRGFLDASRVITPLEVPTGPVDRSMGDVHPQGNPHYLLDPVNGLKVARLIRDKLIDLRPDGKSYFESRYDVFRRRLEAALVGEQLATRYDAERLALLFERGRLRAFLRDQGEESLLGGWLSQMLPHQGAKLVSDHNTWPYFTRRFGLDVIGQMEPKPGIPPTTSHLRALVERMRAEGVKAIVTVPYYDPRHARFVSQHTGSKVVSLAHQVGARAGTDDYVRMVDYNIRQLAAALSGGPS